MKTLHHFNLTGHTLEFKIKPFDVKPVVWVNDAITQIFEKETERLVYREMVGFKFFSKEFRRSDGWISFRPFSKLTINNAVLI